MVHLIHNITVHKHSNIYYEYVCVHEEQAGAAMRAVDSKRAGFTQDFMHRLKAVNIAHIRNISSDMFITAR